MKNIGSIGGEIDVTNILSNLIWINQFEAENLTVLGYANDVETGHKWDLKNRTDMIFGLAWSISEKQKIITTFRFEDYSGLQACDIGNFHAGVMGKIAGIGDLTLLKSAGLAEIVKRIKYGENVLNRLGQLNNNIFPYGDELKDAVWNRTGMNYYRNVISKWR